MSAIVIQQSAEDTKRAFEVNRNASLRSIRLASSKCSSDSRLASANADKPAPNVYVEFHFRSRVLDSPPEVLRVEVGFRMTGGVAGPDSSDLDIEAVFEADYALHKEYKLSPAESQAFKEANAVFNVWPYVREYVQNTVQRMGMPPFTLPFLRLQPKPAKKPKQLGTEAGASRREQKSGSRERKKG